MKSLLSPPERLIVYALECAAGRGCTADDIAALTGYPELRVRAWLSRIAHKQPGLLVRPGIRGPGRRSYYLAHHAPPELRPPT